MSVALTASQPNEAARREFAQALAATAAPVKETHDSALLRGYVLYPYLQAARLLARVQHPVDTDLILLDKDVTAFLMQQGDAPAARELRRDWLLSLSQRNEWQQFAQFYLPEISDVDLRCAWLNAQLALRNSLDANVLKLTWLSAARLPATCNAPFDWAKQQQIINADWIEARARLALKAGNTELANELIGLLPAAQAGPLKQWAQLIEKPQAALDAVLAHPAMEIDSAILLDGWQRLARKDADAAIVRLPRLIAARSLTDVTASPYIRELALALSWSRRPEASSYFTRVLPADMTEQTYEWQARAALWASDWPRAKQVIESMPATLKSQTRWRYWLARVQEESGDKENVTTLYQALVDNDDNYYGALAAARVPSLYVPHPKALQTDAAVTARLAQLPALQRAAELFAVDMRDAADVEWQSVFASFSNAEKEAAAQLAHQWGWYDQMVFSLAKINQFDDYALLYPRPYDAEVDAAARRNGLTADLIYAVMRQETLFRPDAKSVANARGLLQLVPATARQVARRVQLPLPEADDLFKPQVNIPLGAAYLKSLIDQFNGQTVLGLAAYNAGSVSVRRWLPPKEMSADVWIENIPYNETRTYVQRILWHSLIFGWLRNKQAAETTAWLASVPPALATNSR